MSSIWSTVLSSVWWSHGTQWCPDLGRNNTNHNSKKKIIFSLNSIRFSNLSALPYPGITNNLCGMIQFWTKSGNCTTKKIDHFRNIIFFQLSLQNYSVCKEPSKKNFDCLYRTIQNFHHFFYVAAYGRWAVNFKISILRIWFKYSWELELCLAF